MKCRFHNRKISGILTVLPENEVLFDDEVSNYTFPERQTMRLKKTMGYEKHRIAKEKTTSADLAVYGLNYLLERHLISREEIGALIVVTVTPDYFIPHVSNIVQGECDLPQSTFCIDIPQGCCGFLVGLAQGMMMLDYLQGKKVVLINSDVLSHKVSKHDRKSYPLVGDAATVTVLEEDHYAPDMHFLIETDGKRRDVVLIPAGGMKIPCSPETSVMVDDGEGNLRSLENLRMDGNGVFQFVQSDVPPLVEHAMDYAGWNKENVDWFLCHQPNRFVLRKLAERLAVPYEKMPMNIVENFGNASSASIPMTITHNLQEQMLSSQLYHCCLVSFGSGMTWGVVTADLGGMKFCDTIISNL